MVETNDWLGAAVGTDVETQRMRTAFLIQGGLGRYKTRCLLYHAQQARQTSIVSQGERNRWHDQTALHCAPEASVGYQ